MPISKSAKKSLRVAQHKTSINRYRKALIKAALKNVTADTASKAVSMIDKGVKWNLFHQNKAARMKSALMKGLSDGAKIAPKSTEATKTAVAKTEKKVKTHYEQGEERAKRQKAKVKTATQKSKATKS